MKQLDLFEWAKSRPTAKIINALPALCRKAAMETIYQIPRPQGGAKVINNPRWYERNVA
ncbi:hypothetical protein [Rhizobium phaseoli]|uniref:hypothetical protein n=1 Tax=Rhizobium phaseoli TaxID=396 RepID=UPI0016799391|nr:hypothetical protein [Rhizobium phaseoli]